jgi:hypothetical protein
MGYMKNLDLSERFSKLNDAQKNAVINIKTGGTEKIHPATYKALESRGLIVKNGEVWELEREFDREIMVAIDRPVSREESDGDFTPDNIARAMADIELDAESVEDIEGPEIFIPRINRKMLRDWRRNEARINRRAMREQGKRRKKYGAHDPKYFDRQADKLLAGFVDAS